MQLSNAVNNDGAPTVLLLVGVVALVIIWNNHIKRKTRETEY